MERVMVKPLESRFAWLLCTAIAITSLAKTSLAVGIQASGGAGAAAQSAAICIAIVLPTVQGVEGNASDVGAAARELFKSFLSGPSMQVVSLDARLTSQAVEEARQKQCARILTATLTRKRGGGGNVFGRVLGDAAGTAVWHIPGGGSVASAAGRAAAIGAAQATVATLAASTKANDEMRLEYRLASVDGTNVVGPKTDKAKSKVDGEDLLTPLVQRAAEAIAAAVSGK